jgi:hypothetical protein
MLITASEGEGFRYEVTDGSDGYLVQRRDTQRGEVEAGETRLFRTAAVAFAYAELLASFNRSAAARIIGACDADSLEAELVAQHSHYAELSEWLRDEGMEASFILAWEERDVERRRRVRVQHCLQ